MMPAHIVSNDSAGRMLISKVIGMGKHWLTLATGVDPSNKY